MDSCRGVAGALLACSCKEFTKMVLLFQLAAKGRRAYGNLSLLGRGRRCLFHHPARRTAHRRVSEAHLPPVRAQLLHAPHWGPGMGLHKPRREPRPRRSPRSVKAPGVPTTQSLRAALFLVLSLNYRVAVAR